MMPGHFSLRSRIAALHLLIFAILIARRSEGFSKPQFWAEDGFVFFADQIRGGFWQVVGIPYAGYLHVVPRILAAFCSWFPVESIPIAYIISSLIVVTFCCGAFAWPCYRWLVPSDLLRMVCCVVMASAIPAGGELIGSICNLQWFLVPVAILLAMSSHQFRLLGQIATTLTLILIALSTPALFVVVPLFLWQIIRNPGWQRWKSIAILLGLGVQGLMIIHTNGGGSKGHWNFDTLLITTLSGGIAKCVLTLLFGPSFLDGSARSLVAKLILALIVVAVLLTLLLVDLQSWRRRWILLSSVYIASGSIAVVMGGRNLSNYFLLPSDIPHIEGQRYFFLPSCIFIFVAAFGMQFLMDKSIKPNLRTPLIMLFGLAFSLGMVRNFKTTPMTDLSWPSHAAEITKWKQSWRPGQVVAPLVVPVNPPGFYMTLESPR